MKNLIAIGIINPRNEAINLGNFFPVFVLRASLYIIKPKYIKQLKRRDDVTQYIIFTILIGTILVDREAMR